MNLTSRIESAGYTTVTLLPNDIGGRYPGAGDGPGAMMEFLQEKGLLSTAIPITEVLRRSPNEGLPPEKPARYHDLMVGIATDNCQAVHEVLATHTRTLIFSGDHSNAVGSISGLVNAFPNARIGVVWIDAHADAHSPFTTPSGNFHGMPLAALLGIVSSATPVNNVSPAQLKSWEQLTALSGQVPAISPENLVYIGVRSTEHQEDEVLRHKHIRQFSVSDVQERGPEAIASATLSQLNACDYLYVSFDIDSLDKRLVSGTGTPEENGFSVAEAARLLQTLVHHPKTKAFEITELNPGRDADGQSVIQTTFDILQIAFNL